MFFERSVCGVSFTTPSFASPIVLSIGLFRSSDIYPKNILISPNSYSGEYGNQIKKLLEAAKKGEETLINEFESLFSYVPPKQYFDELYALLTLDPLESVVKYYSLKQVFDVLFDISKSYVFIGHNLFGFLKNVLIKLVELADLKTDKEAIQVIRSFSKGIDTCLLQSLLLSDLDLDSLFDYALPYKVIKQYGKIQKGIDLKTCLDYFKLDDYDLSLSSGRAAAVYRLYQAQIGKLEALINV